MKRKLWSVLLSAMLAIVTVFAFTACNPVTYSITFKDYDGTELSTVSVLENGEVSYDGATPSREATAEYTYTFAGWENEEGTVLNELPVATADATYTATYTSAKNSYTVTIMDGETELDSLTLEYGATVEYTGEEPTKDATAQYTYTFAGWSTEEGGEVTGFATVTGNATYYAVFTSTVNKYAITWNVNGETTSETLEYGATPAYDGTPTKDATAQYAYTFAGWSTTADGEVGEIAAVTGEATYYAIFTATTNKYAITWNVNGTTTSVDYAYGATPVYDGTPAKDATAQYTYTFAGWSTAEGGEVGEIAAVTGAQTYYAIFTSTVNKYAITWNVNGTTTSETLEYGATPAYNGTPAKDATAKYTYTFAGWSTAENGEVGEIAAVTGEATYYAIFTSTVNKYAITWNVNGTETTVQVEYDATPAYDGTPAKDATAQYTYTFAGWSTAENGEVGEIATVTGEAKYYAVFTSTVNKYDIVWNVNGETTSETLEYGATPTYNGTPAKDATAKYTYTFAGWSTAEGGEVGEIAAVTGAQTYYAIFTSTVNKYAITWNVNGTETTVQVEYDATPAYDGTPAKDATAKYTYTFAGWSTAENGEVGEIATVTGEAKYYAVFTSTVNKYDIVWNVNGTETTVQVEYDATPAYDGTPAKDATAKYTYTFAGWSTAENGEVGEIAAVTGAQTYYAIFTSTVNEYKITWNMNGLTKEDTVAYDELPVYSGMTPVKGDTMQYAYTFAGWATTADGEAGEIATVTGDQTYYAVYTAQAREYVISFYNETGETLLQAVTFKYGDTVKYPTDVAAPSKAETDGYTYTYTGWKEGTTEYALNAMPTVTGTASYNVVFAQTAKQYTVTVNYVVAGEGEKPANPSSQSVTLDYGTIYNEDNSPVSPTVEGYLPDYYYFGGIVTEDVTYTVTYGKASVWDGTYPDTATYTLEGEGTEASPYLIQSAQDLAYLSAHSEKVADYGKGLFYKLTTNIDLAGETWKPVGKTPDAETTYYYFAGTFDGAGHTIGGLYHYSETNIAIALFHAVSGTLKNLVVEGEVTGKNRTAGVVYVTTAAARLENVTNYVDVTYKGTGNVLCGGIGGSVTGTIINGVNYGDVTGNGARVGAISGQQSSAITATNCINYGDISGTTHNVAGLFGIQTAGSITMEGSANYGAISASTSDATSTGGLIAQASGSSVFTIKNSYNYGTVYGSANVGGIVGYAAGTSTVTVEGCENYGAVTSSTNGKKYTGGILGYGVAAATLSFTDCVNYGNIKATSNVGGILGYGAKYLIKNCTNYGTLDSTAYNKSEAVGGIAGWMSGANAKAENVINYGDVIGLTAYSLVDEVTYGARSHGGIAGYGSGSIKGATNYGNVIGSFYLGGIIGSCNNGIIQDVVNYGDVSSGEMESGEKGIAGVCGWHTGSTATSNAKNYGDVSGYTNVGGVVGYTGAATTVTTVYNYGNVYGVTSTGGVGGHINSSITDGYNEGTVVGESSIGGIAGYNALAVTNCTNKGDVYGTMYVAGIVGNANGNGTNNSIVNCTNNGNVYGIDKFGGIAGNTFTTAITGCINNGAVGPNGELNAGIYAAAGIVGHATNNTVITDCTNNGNVTGDDVVGGIAGYLGAAGETLPASQIVDSYNNGTVNGWDEGSTDNLAGNNKGEIIYTEDETPEAPIE